MELLFCLKFVLSVSHCFTNYIAAITNFHLLRGVSGPKDVQLLYDVINFCAHPLPV